MTAISKKESEFLRIEAAAWTKEGIISAEQASSILALYEVKEYSLRRILFTAGLVLLALGGVSFIAAHWHELPKLFRVCVIVAGHIAAMTAYFFTRKTRAGSAFLLLGSVIFGAGIYLITRMYNYHLTVSAFLAWWLLQILFTTFCTRDTWQEHFGQAVSLLYMNWINAIDIFALEFMGSASESPAEFFSPIEGFVLLMALWLVCSFVRNRPAFSVNMLLTLLVFASRMSVCFGGTWTLIVLACVGVFLSFSRNPDAEVFGLLLVGLCGLMLTWPEVWRGIFVQWRSVLAVVSAVLTACVMLVNVWRGHGAAGVTFCVLLIVRYFFDRLFGYMPKAWGFTLLGIAFLIGSAFFERLRAKFGK